MKTTIKLLIIGLITINMVACGSAPKDEAYSVELPSGVVMSLEKTTVDCRAGFVTEYLNEPRTELSEAMNGIEQTDADGYEFTIDVEFRTNGDAFVTHLEDGKIINTVYGFIYEGKLYFRDLCAGDIIYKF